MRRLMDRPDTPSGSKVGDMAQAGHDRLQNLRNQKLFKIKERGFFRASCFEFRANLPRGLLLSCFSGICFTIICTAILMTECPLDEAIAELVFFIATLIVLAQSWMKGTNIHLARPNDLVRGVMRIAANKQLLMLCFVGSLINGAKADDQNEGFQSWTLSVWELIRHHGKAATWTLLAGLIIGVGVAWRMIFNRRPAFTDEDIDNGLRFSPTPRRNDPNFEIHPRID